MDKFLGTYSLPRLSQEETENMNIPITINKIEAVTKNLPTNKNPRLDEFTGKFYKTFTKEHLYFSNYSKKFKRREDFQAHYIQGQPYPDSKTR